MSSIDVSGIADVLSRAALGIISWPSAMEIVATTTRSMGVVLLPVVGELPLLCATDSLQESFDRYIDEGWIERDERYLGFSKFMSDGIVTDDDCLPKEVRRRSPFYQEFIARSGLNDFAGVRVGRRDNVWNLSLQRSVGQDPFSADELRTLANLSQRLDAVVEISAALGLAKGAAALDAFQMSKRAAILLDRSGKLVLANPAAEQLITAEFRVVAGRLQCYAREDTATIEQLARALLWSKTLSTLAPAIVRKRNGGKLVVYSSLIGELNDSPMTAFHAMLVICDLEERQIPINTTWQLVFELTPTEARIANAISQGKDPAAYAQEAAVSRETVRSHLKRIFDKTGTSSQSQLAALASTLLPDR